MKNKIKKIMTTSLLSAVAFSAIGCATTNNKLAKNIDKGMAEFVSSINKLDYVDTSSETTNKVGKIVETSNNTNFLNENINTLNIENTITKPSERTDNFKLYVLSNKPFISLTSNDNSTSLDINFQFSTDLIEQTSDEINENINNLILKRSILMIYVNEIYNGNISLTEEHKIAINAYVNVIKENASFLNGNRGMVKNQLGIASDLIESNKNDSLVNYYIIKSGEALETRSNKINSTISAIDSIISILESNLSPSSAYYNSKLSNTYQNMITNFNSTSTNTDISNIEIANKIAESLRFKTELNINNSTNNTTSDNNLNNSTDNTINTQTSRNISNSTLQKNNLNQSHNINNNSTTHNNNQNQTNNSESNNSSLNNNNSNDYISRNSKTIQNESVEKKETTKIENNTINGNINNRSINDTARRHNRIRRRNRLNNNQNNIDQSQNSEVRTMDENYQNQTTNNHSKLRTNEEYSNTSNSNINNNSRATRVPYQTTSTFNEQ